MRFSLDNDRRRELLGVLVSVLALLIPCSEVKGQTCGNGALQLTSGRARLGDTWSASVTGAPGLTTLFGFDTDPGPVALPSGNICLGLTPSLLLYPLTLDASGSGRLDILLPAHPFFDGQTWYTQVSAPDPLAPGGLAISNGARIDLQSPRIYTLERGSVTAGAPVLPGIVRAFNATTGALLWTTNLPPAKRLRSLPEQGLLLVENDADLAGGEALRYHLLSATTGAIVWTNQAYPAPLISDDQQHIVVWSSGQLRCLNAQTGNQVASVPMPGGLAPIQGLDNQVIPIEGRPGVYYLVHANGVELIDVNLGGNQGSIASLSLHPFLGTVRVTQGQGRLAIVQLSCTTAFPCSIFGVDQLRAHIFDTTTDTLVTPSPTLVTTTGGLSSISCGSTPSGTGFLMAHSNPPVLQELRFDGTLGASVPGPGIHGMLTLNSQGTTYTLRSRDANLDYQFHHVDGATLAVGPQIAVYADPNPVSVHALGSDSLDTMFLGRGDRVETLDGTSNAAPQTFALLPTPNSPVIAIADDR